MSPVANSITTEQLISMPDDGMDRELIRGELREKPMTKRNRFHTYTEAAITFLIRVAIEQLPEPRGEVHSGEVGTILRRDPDSTVGIDVAYFSTETMASQTHATTLIEGVPQLAVEVLSPSDKLEEIREKVVEYLDVGVPLVWIVDPYFQTIQVHRPNQPPVTYNSEQEITGERIVPGLKFSVAEVFQPQQS